MKRSDFRGAKCIKRNLDKCEGVCRTYGDAVQLQDITRKNRTLNLRKKQMMMVVMRQMR